MRNKINVAKSFLLVGIALSSFGSFGVNAEDVITDPNLDPTMSGKKDNYESNQSGFPLSAKLIKISKLQMAYITEDGPARLGGNMKMEKRTWELNEANYNDNPIAKQKGWHWSATIKEEGIRTQEQSRDDSPSFNDAPVRDCIENAHRQISEFLKEAGANLGKPIEKVTKSKVAVMDERGIEMNAADEIKPLVKISDGIVGLRIILKGNGDDCELPDSKDVVKALLSAEKSIPGTTVGPELKHKYLCSYRGQRGGGPFSCGVDTGSVVASNHDEAVNLCKDLINNLWNTGQCGDKSNPPGEILADQYGP